MITTTGTATAGAMVDALTPPSPDLEEVVVPPEAAAAEVEEGDDEESPPELEGIARAVEKLELPPRDTEEDCEFGFGLDLALGVVVAAVAENEPPVGFDDE